MNKLIREGLKEEYITAKNRLVLLDYDGTLVNFTPVPETVILPGHLTKILTGLIQSPQSSVYIITGRGFKSIDKILDKLPVNIIADHGAMIRENGIWKNQLNGDPNWKEKIFPLLNKSALSCPKSFVEEKTFSLSWHYRNAENKSGYIHSRELISILDKIIQLYDLKILDGNKVVEIMKKEVGKGKAVQKLVEQNNYDFILSVGDDTTDEEMFEYLLSVPGAYSIKVGKGNTFARYKLTGIDDVVLLLKHLTK